MAEELYKIVAHATNVSLVGAHIHLLAEKTECVNSLKIGNSIKFMTVIKSHGVVCFDCTCDEYMV